MGAVTGGAKLHEYLFSKIRLKDGRRTKNIGGITKADLTAVDRQKNIGSAKSLVGTQKSCEQKKRSP